MEPCCSWTDFWVCKCCLFVTMIIVMSMIMIWFVSIGNLFVIVLIITMIISQNDSETHLKMASVYQRRHHHHHHHRRHHHHHHHHPYRSYSHPNQDWKTPWTWSHYHQHVRWCWFRKEIMFWFILQLLPKKRQPPLAEKQPTCNLQKHPNHRTAWLKQRQLRQLILPIEEPGSEAQCIGDSSLGWLALITF